MHRAARSSLDDVAKTRAFERALYRLFLVNEARITRERCLLHCMSSFMARLGLGPMSDLSPLSGEERKSNFRGGQVR